MRKLAILISGLLVLALALLAALAIALPRIVQTERVDRALRSAATRALGAPVEWQGLEVGILPPRLTVEQPTLTRPKTDPDPAPDSGPEEAKIEARSIDLRLAWRPLLQRRVRIDSLVVHGLDLVVTRTETGWILPIGGADEDAPATKETETEAGVDVVLRELFLEEGRVVLRDTARPTPLVLEVDAITLAARGESLDEPIALDGEALVRLDGEELGRIEPRGTATLAGAYDLDIGLDAIPVKLLERFAPDLEIEGLATGEVSLVGEPKTSPAIAATLRVPSLRVAGKGAELEGALDLTANLEAGLGDDRESESPIEIEAAFISPDAGRLGVAGTTSQAGVLDLALELEALDLSLANAFLAGAETTLAGRATGQGRLAGPAATPDLLSLDLNVADGALQMNRARLTGPFALVLEMKQPLSGDRQGELDLDLSASALAYGESFRKRAGDRAEATARFSAGDAGGFAFESTIALRDVAPISLDGSIGDATAFVLTTPELDVEGWSETFPVLGRRAAKGRIAFTGFRLEPRGDAPSRLGGRIDLNRLSLRISGAGESSTPSATPRMPIAVTRRIELRGGLLGEGTALRADRLTAHSAGLDLSVAGKLDDPFGATRYDLQIQSIEAAETNTLLSAWTSARDILFGPLAIEAEVAGELGGARGFLESAQGRLSFSVGRDGGGRLRGESILRRALEKFPILGDAARLTAPFRGGAPISSYFREDFVILEGQLDVADAAVRARPLRLAYEGYEANLAGVLRLDDLGLDMTGELFLESELVGLLMRLVGADAVGAAPLTIPLARVTRSLPDPKISMTSGTLAAVPKFLLRQSAGAIEAPIRRGIGEAIERVLGAGRDRDREETDGAGEDADTAPPAPAPAGEAPADAPAETAESEGAPASEDAAPVPEASAPPEAPEVTSPDPQDTAPPEAEPTTPLDAPEPEPSEPRDVPTTTPVPAPEIETETETETPPSAPAESLPPEIDESPSDATDPAEAPAEPTGPTDPAGAGEAPEPAAEDDSAR